jgi:ATP-dependent DNA helicase RecQ
MFSPQDFQQLQLQTLAHYWGYSTFRDLQEEIINSILSGKDTIALLPTGGGKSLCYQLPALLLDGVCIVVSPLLALMKDQVNQLERINIDAVYLSSELDDIEAETIYDKCKNGLVKILYVSPERLINPQFLQQVEEISISFIAVDEAHCISEWGQDFRPSYQHIKSFRNLVKNVPIIALTATATPKVLLEIQEKLELKKPTVFKKSFLRKNIKIAVYDIADKFQQIFDWLKVSSQSGIIYTRTRKEAEELSKFLQNKGLKNCDFFHAGLTPKIKHEKQLSWQNSDTNVLISTNAFGMGIDKDNVRFVIHFSLPASLENYYQEIGRAGRDGQDSYAFLLWNEQELIQFDDILKNSIPNNREFTTIASYLYSVFQIAENELPEEVFQLNYQKLQNLTKISRAKIKNVLQFFHHQEIVYLNDFKGQSSLELLVNVQNLDDLSKKDAYFLELLFRALPGIGNHKVHFTETAVSNKMGIDILLMKERIKELKNNKYLEYIDGDQSRIRFLEHRNDRAISGKYYKLFLQIQKNRLQKWEEMKYFARNNDYCKMKMILSYFGEKDSKSCGQCSVCEKNNIDIFRYEIPKQIVNILSKKPSTMDELAFHLSFISREELLENIILLLDAEKIKMKDFRTYALPS